VSEVLQALDLYCGYGGGYWELDSRTWAPANQGVLPARAQAMKVKHLGLPGEERKRGSVKRASVLWAWVDTEPQLERARAFEPLPTIVLKEGRVCLLLWALENPLPRYEIQEVNTRLAHRLKARRRLLEPNALRIPVPGPRVQCTRLTTDSYERVI
jgi:hypothetical protein